MKPGARETSGALAHVSRRSFLQAGAVGVTGLAVGPRVAWAQGKGEAKRGGALVVRSGPIRGIDPHMETWATTLQVVHQAYNALLKFNHDGTKILPDLAESWEQKDDLSYAFRLRQGVKFHNVPPVNGRELTSEDVKYSIERQMTNQPGKFQHAYFFLDKLAGIQTPDKYTIVFKTKEPYAPSIDVEMLMLSPRSASRTAFVQASAASRLSNTAATVASNATFFNIRTLLLGRTQTKTTRLRPRLSGSRSERNTNDGLARTRATAARIPASKLPPFWRALV